MRLSVNRPAPSSCGAFAPRSSARRGSRVSAIRAQAPPGSIVQSATRAAAAATAALLIATSPASAAALDSLLPPPVEALDGVVLAALGSGEFGSLNKLKLPDLPYDYSALEPAISGDIMRLHHDKHHQAYVTGYNANMDKLAALESKGDLPGALALQPALRFNGGGHINHSIFWTNLTPAKDYAAPTGELLAKINESFGSLDNLKAKMSSVGAAVQGSGWAWLGYDKEAGRLVVATTSNQDPLAYARPGTVPLLGIDVWEHAYYLQYKNARPEYLKAIWQVVNWKNVGERLAAAKA